MHTATCRVAAGLEAGVREMIRSALRFSILATIAAVGMVQTSHAYTYDANYLRIVHTVPEPTATPTPGEAWKLTFYSSSPQEGTDRTTASGMPVSRGVLAVPNRNGTPVIPYGTEVYLEGMGEYTVLDTGGGLQGRHADAWVPTRREAFRLGVKHVTMTVKERE